MTIRQIADTARIRPLIRAALALFLVLAAAFPAGCSRKGAELNVYAAVSLTESLKEVGDRFEKATGARVNFNFGASSALALQIEAGAPADVFFPADEASLDRLASRGLVTPGTRRTLLSNRLVVVTRREFAPRIRKTEDLLPPEVGRIAVAEPSSVPAGIYARRYLESVGLWDRLSDRIIPVENVRAVLAAVVSGDAAAGIVYRTDAEVSPEVSIAIDIPAGEGPAIFYPAAVLRDARSPDLARSFVTFLGTPEALQIFRNHSFEPAAPNSDD